MKTKFNDGYIKTSDGINLHYIEAGSGASIIFVPGWIQPAWLFEPQLEHFSKKYRVIALDPRAHGESDMTTEGLYPDQRAEDLHELIKQLALSPTVLVGWSNGVLDVLTYIKRYGTDTLAAVGLIDAGFQIEEEVQQSMADFVSSMVRNREELTEKWLRSMFKSQQSDDFFQRLTNDNLKVPSACAVAMFYDYLVRKVDFTNIIEGFDRPLFYFVSEQSEQAVLEAKKLTPYAKVEVFRDAGHALFVDQAEKFNILFEEAIESISG